MDNPEFQAPKPQAMSDAELEIALEQAKSSTDGLLAAMILLEQQEQLRRADAAAIAAWLEEHPPVQSEHVEQAGFEEHSKPQFSEQPQEVVEPESSLEPAEPEFDSILDAAVHEATESVETIEQTEAESSASLPAELEHEPDIAPLSAADLAVTGTLDQIISGVNQTFESASESVTADEETLGGNDEPLPSAAIPIVRQSKPSPLAKVTDAVKGLPLVEYLAAIAAIFVAIKLGASISTTLVALVIGIVLQTSIAFMFRLNEARGGLSHSIMNRATFGVWGAHLPGALALLARLVLIGAFSSWLVASLDKTTSLGDFNLASPSALWFASNGILLSSTVAFAAALLAMSNRASLSLSLLSLLTSASGFIWLIALGGAPILGSPEPGTAVGLGVSYAIVTGMLARQSFNVGKPWRGVAKELQSLVGVRVVPSIILTGLAAFAAFGVSATLESSAPLNEFNRAFSGPLATLANFAVALTVVALIAHQSTQVAEGLRSFNLQAKGLIATLVLVLALLSPWLVTEASQVFGDLWPVIAIGLIAISTTPYLTEAILRRSNFHEVSLLRSYAFYKKVNIWALVGVLTFATLLVGCTPGPLRFIPIQTPTWFGEATILVVLVVAIKFWTLATSFARVRFQESELAQVEIRRNELAGLDFIE
jgi:hypothetical protein